MRGPLRALFWVALFAAVVLLVPAALPPDRSPTYPAPLWVDGAVWDYRPTTTFQGPSSPAGNASVHTGLHPLLGPNASQGLAWDFTDEGTSSSSPSWPFLTWGVAIDNATWSSWSWFAGCIDYTMNLTGPGAWDFPMGLSFPLGAGGSFEAVRNGSLEYVALPSPCPLAPRSSPSFVREAGGPAEVSLSGSYTRMLPAGATSSCVLYVCNEDRVYLVNALLTIAPTGGPSFVWRLRMLYDPTISGFRDLSESPSSSSGFVPGSVNLTLASTAVPGSSPNPPGVLGYAESAGLVGVVPLMAAFWELRRARRREEVAYEADVKAVLAALPPELAGNPPPEGSYESDFVEEEKATSSVGREGGEEGEGDGEDGEDGEDEAVSPPVRSPSKEGEAAPSERVPGRSPP